VRFHGRNGLVYLAITSGGQAEPLAFQAAWSADFTHDVLEATCALDTQRTWVAGLADVSGTFAGFADDATSQTYIAATDGQPRSMYLYPDSRDPGQYIAGQVLVDLATSGAAGGAVQVSAAWAAAGQVTRTGPDGTYSGTYTDSY
jgi:hypothetical protein